MARHDARRRCGGGRSSRPGDARPRQRRRRRPRACGPAHPRRGRRHPRVVHARQRRTLPPGGQRKPRQGDEAADGHPQVAHRRASRDQSVRRVHRQRPPIALHELRGMGSQRTSARLQRHRFSRGQIPEHQRGALHPGPRTLRTQLASLSERSVRLGSGLSPVQRVRHEPERGERVSRLVR